MLVRRGWGGLAGVRVGEDMKCVNKCNEERTNEVPAWELRIQMALVVNSVMPLEALRLRPQLISVNIRKRRPSFSQNKCFSLGKYAN